MGWSYNPALKTDKDRVRYLVGDVQSAAPLVQDEEIEWVLTQEANIYAAAAAVCDVLAAAQSKGLKSRTVGSLSRTFGPEHWTDRAKRLRSRGAAHQLPYAGGLSATSKEAFEADADRVLGALRRGMHDNVEG